MMNLDTEKMQTVVAAARAAVAGDKRWTNAITRAAAELESNPYMAEQGGALLILSSTSQAIYSSNGTCGCEAYRRGFPCWHRAAARLVARYRETS